MKNRLLLLTAFAIFLAGCAMMTTGLKETNPIGKVYINSIQLDEKIIPLPEGEWKVIGRGGTSNSLQDPYFEIILLKEIENKKLHSLLIITTESMINNFNGYLRQTYLDRVDVLYSVVKNNNTQEAHDGWLINHIRSSLDVKRPAYKEAYDYLVSNSYAIPINVISIFHHFTGKYKKNKYLNVGYYINPDIEGFEPTSNAEWASSDWHPLQINKDSKKVEYIERLKKEGAIMHEKIRVGFGD